MQQSVIDIDSDEECGEEEEEEGEGFGLFAEDALDMEVNTQDVGLEE